MKICPLCEEAPRSFRGELRVATLETALSENQRLKDLIAAGRAAHNEDRVALDWVSRENERLRAALNEYADHAADSGWSNLAAEIRRRATPSSSDAHEEKG